MAVSTAESLVDKLRAAALHSSNISGGGKINSSGDGDWQDVAAAQLESLYPWAGEGKVFEQAKGVRDVTIANIVDSGLETLPPI